MGTEEEERIARGESSLIEAGTLYDLHVVLLVRMMEDHEAGRRIQVADKKLISNPDYPLGLLIYCMVTDVSDLPVFVDSAKAVKEEFVELKPSLRRYAANYPELDKIGGVSMEDDSHRTEMTGGFTVRREWHTEIIVWLNKNWTVQDYYTNSGFICPVAGAQYLCPPGIYGLSAGEPDIIRKLLKQAGIR